MPYTEMLGFLAAGFVLATFMMRTMLPLRVLGIASNITFISYGWLHDLPPVLVLHATLLPVNLYRLFELHRLVRDMNDDTASDGNFGWLVPYTRAIERPPGQVLFRKDDRADAMYIIVSGRVRLDELGVELGADDVLGEIGVFTPQGRRTATAICMDDCRLRQLTRGRAHELVLQNPQFAYHLIGIVTRRLVDNLSKAEAQLAALRTAGR